MDDPDTIPSRLHEVDTRPPPVQPEHPSPFSWMLAGILVAVAVAVGWFVLRR